MTTTLLEQRTNLNLGFSAQAGGQPPRKSLVLKPSAGQQGAAAHFSLLPTQKPRLGVMGASLTVQLAILGVLLLLPLVFPQRLITKTTYDVMPVATPRTEVPVAKPEPVKPRPQPVPVEVAKVLPPVQPKMIVPHVVAPKVLPKPEKVETPKITTPVLETPKVELAASTPAQPRRPVETGVIANTGSAAPATLNKPADKVQTGGFGDPQGIGGPSNPNARANINHVGSFDLPPGPGYGNGTGGANGARGTVQSTGFGNGTAIAPTGNGGGLRGSVQQSGFAQAVVDPTKAKAQQQQQAAMQAVEILDKPKPEYTDEARALKLEGEVILKVNFKANGQIEVLGVTHGLGHGLDESAIRAAQKIKYKPAISNGQAVDFPATVHIEFQLAY